MTCVLVSMEETDFHSSQQHRMQSVEGGRESETERKSRGFMTRLKQTLDFRSSGPEPRPKTSTVSGKITRTASTSAAGNEFRHGHSREEMMHADPGQQSKTSGKKRVTSFSVRSGSSSGNRVVAETAADVERRDVGDRSSKPTPDFLGSADRWLASTDGGGRPRAATEQLARGPASDVDHYPVQRQNSEMKQLAVRSDTLAAAPIGRTVPAANLEGRRAGRPSQMTFNTPNAVDDDEHCSPDSAYHSPFNGSKTTLVYGGSAQQNGSEGHQRRRQSSRLEQSSKGHEKSPSWPPADLQMSTASNSSGVSSRTSSWSGNASSSQMVATEFMLVPRLGGTRVDDRPPPAAAGPYTTSRGYDDPTSGILRRHRPRADADFHAAVSTRLSNYTPDAGDGDRAMQSRRRPHSDFFPVDKLTRQSSYTRAMGASQDSSGPEDSPLSPPPPPLPATSPPRGSVPSMSDSTITPERPGKYPYSLRLRPFYNTSTQTEQPVGDPQVGNGGDDTADGRPPRMTMKTSQSYSTALQFQQAADAHSKLSSSVGELRSLQLMVRQPAVTDVDVDGGTPTFDCGESDGATGLNGRDKGSVEDLVDQTSIFRRLSKELYGPQPRYGQTVRTSVDSGVSGVQFGLRPPSGNRKLDSRFVSMTDNGVSPMTTTMPPGGDSSQLDVRDDFDADAESHFVRTRKSQLSLRKAFGIFEEVDAVGERMLALAETVEEDPELQLLHPNSALPGSRGASASGDENHLQRRSKERPTSDSGGHQPRRQRGASGAPNGKVSLPTTKTRAMSTTDGGHGRHLVDRSASSVQNRSNYACDVHSSFSSSGSGSGSSVGLVSVYGRTSNTDSAGVLPASPRDVVSPVMDLSDSVQLRVRQSVSLPRGVTPPDSGYYGFNANSSHNSSFPAFEDHRRRSLENKQSFNDSANTVQPYGISSRSVATSRECDSELSVRRHIESWSSSTPQDQESSGDLNSPPPPVLPPRRYRTGVDQASSCVAATTSRNNIDSGEATLPPDDYANRLRQQARRLSQSKGSFLQSKPSAPPNWRPPPPPVQQSTDDHPSEWSQSPLSSQISSSSLSIDASAVPPQGCAEKETESERCKLQATGCDNTLGSSNSSLSTVQYSTRDEKLAVNGDSRDVHNVAAESNKRTAARRGVGAAYVNNRLADSEDGDHGGVTAAVPTVASSEVTVVRERVSKAETRNIRNNVRQSAVPPSSMSSNASILQSESGTVEVEETQALPRDVSAYKSSPPKAGEASSTYADVTQTGAPAKTSTERLPSFGNALHLGRKLDTAIVAPSVRESSAKDDVSMAPSAIVSERGKELGLANGNTNIPENSKNRACEICVPKNFYRHRLSQELEYERLASMFVKRLKTFDRDRQLVDVISPPSDCRMPIDFMTSVDGKDQLDEENELSESMRHRLTARTACHRSSLRDGNTVNICSTGPSPMLADTVHNQRTTHDWMTNGGMETDKSVLIDLLEKKLSALRQQKQLLDEEMVQNNSLGLQVKTSAELKLPSREREKYHQFVRDVDKVTCLLLKLSDMLVRAENAVRTLPETCTAKEKERLMSKRNELAQKHEDARLLKDDIDERSRPFVNMLYQSLSPSEFSDYQYFILMKSQLAIELQDVEHAIQLGDRQLQLLHSSANILALHSSDC